MITIEAIVNSPFWAEARKRLPNYIQLVRLHRPIGILLLLWPSMWGLWIASDGHPPLGVLLIFVLGVVLMRSAGCAINDFADREIDLHVERTAGRPLATGLVAPGEAVWVFLALSGVAFLLVLFLNWQTILMSFVAAILATAYPFMKRYTHLPQLVLGVAFGWAVPMAFMAVTENVPPVGWLLFVATVLWALIYDTQYAMADRDDDLRIGVKSTAILFGEYDREVIGILQITMLGILWLVGGKADLGVFYYLGLFAASVSAAYQQILIREREPKGCFNAFLNNNLFGLLVFTGLYLDYLF